MKEHSFLNPSHFYLNIFILLGPSLIFFFNDSLEEQCEDCLGDNTSGISLLSSTNKSRALPNVNILVFILRRKYIDFF